MEPTPRPAPAFPSGLPEGVADARFDIPAPAPWHVSRPRLLDVLDRADSVPLVVVSAPAGTGKTALAAEWARRRADRATTGWVTFDDTGPAFWVGVIDGLARLGLGVPPALRADPPDGCLGPRRVMALAHAIARAPQRVTLVVDGADLRSAELAHDVDVVLRHTGGRLCLVVTSRADPALPLYRYRLTGTVREIRTGELAFTDDEAAELLGKSGTTLSRLLRYAAVAVVATKPAGNALVSLVPAPEHRTSLPEVPSRPRLPAPAQVARQGDVAPWELPVVDSLTAKEREVLGRLEELLTTEEIAEKMFVSVNTVRTHVRSILRKLGVNRRNAAVRKARALGLLAG